MRVRSQSKFIWKMSLGSSIDPGESEEDEDIIID